MPTNNINPLEQFLSSWNSNDKYFDMLAKMSSISKLFSDSEIPYLDYRLAENLFCKYYNAINDARSCTAYDARLSSLGIGIKTFILKNGSSIEKIAEFNKLRPELNGLKGKDLARKLGEFRNERMRFANRNYNINQTQYHIVGRCANSLKIFNTSYDEIILDDIQQIHENESSLSFTDGRNEYIFNKSKSVLQKRFILPNKYTEVKVNIISDPLELLENFFNGRSQEIAIPAINHRKGQDYVILPLYAKNNGIKYVAERSGLNQWNAHGRKRNANEVYIPVPADLRNRYPNFFPDRDKPFDLELPDGHIINAKICQENGKALMSNPNSELGEYLLRKILQKNPNELVTISDLNKYGFDSVCIERHSQNDNNTPKFKLYFTDSYGDFESFLEDD